jgi:uncharacterized protein
VIYLDTSVLGAIFFREANASLVLSQIEAIRHRELAISAWTLTEMASVGAIKERVGSVDGVTRRQALLFFHRFASATLRMTEVAPEDFRVAASLMDGPWPLRSGDALHLAVAKRLAAELATLDRRQADAALGHGIALFSVG